MSIYTDLGRILISGGKTAYKFGKKIDSFMDTNNQANNKNGLAQEIVKTHLLLAVGGGLIPLPFVDFAAVTGVQVNMVRSLSKLYGKDFNEQIGKSLVTALVGTSLARMAASAVKTIPLLGSILGTATQAVLSGASTYAVGQVFIHHFDKGGSLSDFSPEDLKEKYKAEFERGKEFSIRAEKEQKSNMQSKEDIFNALEKLNSLKEKGIVSEEEYQAQKAKLLARI
ncbi:MAG: DUF697 domain-containing protein [Saprospiraceae bacterium]|nr:DUF697 domain-containing protein [Saprospiraceae bacterium]